ncbi:CLAVATA3/ESR (CLE)-related protein 10 [Heracleum sosnowskyi]|uniref:CLAVATA3/ESR (CLE)-related protein 10 n=1 Tax=Heracleum sosnowskyi TaxID=360622 RepID=A0AAD8I632_9APIA|nr:CLAVATA3/ESR (CLE)-related protein 10 [Heracleum sosnowskyi]
MNTNPLSPRRLHLIITLLLLTTVVSSHISNHSPEPHLAIHRRYHILHRSCTSFPKISSTNSKIKTPPPVFCFQYPKKPYMDSPARSHGGAYEIDPRYGVEKRLVPSGPNPLHN